MTVPHKEPVRDPFRTATIVRSFAVRAVAQALLQRGYLSGDEAERIIHDNLDEVTRDRLERRIA